MPILIPYTGIRRAIALGLVWWGVARTFGCPAAAVVLGAVLLALDVITIRRTP